MKFIIVVLMTIAFIAAFIYAVGLIFGKKEKTVVEPLEDLDKKADEVVKSRDEIEKKAGAVEKKASDIKKKIK